jgi:putative ABC transport system ATP-binding protein
VIESLPSGIDTNVGERGTSLSGGQRQRVALARALAANPPVLVLHEPTTAVDTATEAAIADGLRALRAQRTTILVTTSPTLLAVCDEVLLLAHGRVQARGSHDDLLGDDRYQLVVLS